MAISNMSKCVDCVSCPCRLPEETARHVDALAKTLPSGLSFQKKTLGVEYQFEPGERAEVSILTAATVDKSMEVVLPEGVELDSYRRSSIVLWNHDHARPVATCGWIKLFKDALRAKTVYPEKPEDVDTQWFTDEVWAMTKCVPPILRCKSIGFLPLVPLRDPTPDELEHHPDWQGAVVWERTLLLEYSCVYNGCNDDALVEAVNRKSLDPARLADLGVTLPAPVSIPEPQPLVQNVPGCCGDRLARYKSSDCVSEKVRELRSQGMDEDEAIAVAYATCHGKPVKRKVAKPKPLDVDRLTREVAERLDADRILRRAEILHKNRGKV